MKNKRAVVMVFILLVSVLAGCSANSNKMTETGITNGKTSVGATGADSDSNIAEKNTTDTWDGEVSNIVVSYVTMGTAMPDLKKVETAVNEITVPNIGVNVEFKEISVFDTPTLYSLWITSGNTVDLMLLMALDITTYSSQGLIQPMDQLLDNNAPTIEKRVAEGFPLYDGSYLDGEVYGVSPLSRSYGSGGAFMVLKKYIDGAGISYDEDKVYTLDEMTDIFAAIKEAYPDIYPCGQVTSSMGSGTVAGLYGIIYDALGTSVSSGVLLGKDSTEVVNLFATDAYYNYLKHVKQWHDLGYIHPDASTTDQTIGGLALTGVTAGYPMGSSPESRAQTEDTLGEPSVLFKFSDPYFGAASSVGAFWTVPITSEAPEAAVRFLDYTYSNHDLQNLLMWGIEGEHFVVVDKDKLLIDFPEGVNATTSGFYNAIDAYGDRRYEYTWNEENSKAKNEKYTKTAMENKTQGVGFLYNSVNMQTEIANIDAVLTKYMSTLESGSAADLDALYEEFLEALNTAGINDVIADKQAQFDEWRASNLQ